MALSFQFLGTGTSVGVPQIGCHCPTCSSADPRDRRRRTGIHVRGGRAAFLVDTPPEMRLAAIELGIEKVDAVVFTHAHMDHIAGFDDVRRFNTLNGGVPMRCYGAPETLAAVREIFPYITDRANDRGLFRPLIHYVPITGPFAVGDVDVTPFAVEHGGPRTNGYLFACDGRRFAYASDCHSLSDEAVELMRGVDVLVLDCLRERPHPTHLEAARTLDYVARIDPGRAFIVHMCHDLSHRQWEEKLPPRVRPAYDGLVVEV